MKHLFLTIIIGLIPLLPKAQTNNSGGRFGVVLNSSINGEVYPFRLTPTVTYLKGNNQFELGLGLHPFIQKDQKVFSAEMNYKYFPNGIDNKFNMYLVGQLFYLHNPRETYFPTTYNYLFLNGGYGFEINLSKNMYMGTNMTIGTYTFSKRSEIPYASFSRKDLFDEFGFNLAFQFSLGYRF